MEMRMEYAAVSLPRALFGCNSRVIASQNAINRAVSRVSDILDEITHPPASQPVYTRLDLVWQVKGDIRQFILAYKHALTPFVHTGAAVYTDSSLRWEGTGFLLQMYDKILQVAKSPGKIVRIEAQLRGKRLVSLMGKRIKHLDFKDLYAKYREILLSLNQTPVPKLHTLSHILAFCERNGIDAVSFWSIGKNPAVVRRKKKEIAAIQIEYLRLDMAALFPVFVPPKPIQLFHPKVRKNPKGCAKAHFQSTTARFRVRPRRGTIF